jgi:hypothetical protein
LADPKSSGFDRDDGTSLQVAAVEFENPHACWAMLRGAEADDPYDPCVWVSACDRELTEVLVKRHEDATFRLRRRKNFIVAGIY